MFPVFLVWDHIRRNTIQGILCGWQFSLFNYIYCKKIADKRAKLHLPKGHPRTNKS